MFLLSSVTSALITAVALGIVRLISLLDIMMGIQLFTIVAAIGCYVSNKYNSIYTIILFNMIDFVSLQFSSLLVWNCSPCIKKMRQLRADRQKSSDKDIEMDSMNTT